MDNPILSFTTFAPATPNPDRAFYSQQNVLKQASTAAFGQATWHIDDVWSLTAGVRYTDDLKHASTRFRYVFYNPAFGLALNVTPTPVGDYIADPSFAGLQLKIHDTGVTSRLGVEYKPTDQTLAYLSYARGYKAGGFTLGDAVANNVTKPEHLNAYEAGVKQDFSSTLKADATVFYYDYRDMQIPVSALNATTGGVFARYTNFPKARMYGLELQATWSPTEALWLNANYTYLNAETREFCCAVDFTQTPTVAQDLKGRDLPRSPHNKAALAGTYTWTFQPGSLILGGSVAYNGAFYSNAFENPLFKVPGYTVANVSATWRSEDNRYELVGQVTNLFDNDYATRIDVGGANVAFAETRYLAAARSWTVLLRYRF
jgi:iron complex outermembrane receptor protein